jgi:hypothetical protein
MFATIPTLPHRYAWWEYPDSADHKLERQEFHQFGVSQQPDGASWDSAGFQMEPPTGFGDFKINLHHSSYQFCFFLFGGVGLNPH